LILSRGRIVLTDFDRTKGNHGTIDFVDNIVDFLQIVGVGDDLVTSDKVLHQRITLVLDSPTICTIGQSFSLEAQKRGRFTQALNTNLVNNHDGGKFEEELMEIEVVSRVEVRRGLVWTKIDLDRP
jgi:hypothetical protein